MTLENVTALLARLADPGSAYSVGLEAGLANEPAALRGILRPRRQAEVLGDALREQPWFPPASGMMLQRGDGGSGFGPVEAARFLLRRVARGISPARATEELETLLAMAQAGGRYILTVWGVTVERTVVLSEGTAIERWQDLPDSPQKEWISAAASSDAKSPLVPSFFLWVPRVAITIRHEVTPLFRLGDSAPPVPSRLLSDLADEIRLALTVIGPSAPLSAAAWFQFDDPLVQDAVSYGGVSTHHIEILPFFYARETLIPEADARRVVANYVATTNKPKRKLTLALQRLNNARRRRFPGDMALELATCLELLLVDAPGEHTFKVALRAANLWSGSLQDKQRVRSIVEGVYKVRSAMVHSAEAPPLVRLRDIGDYPTDRLLEEALAAVATIVRTILAAREIPDWALRDLTE